MSIVEIIEKKLDPRREGTDCDFNGYLEDFIQDIDELEINDVIKSALKSIVEEDNQAKICVNLRMPVNKEAISNQIIRYKDIFKLNGNPIILPFIIYGKKESKERAMLIIPFEEYSHIFAKGYYYCMTEPGSDFTDCKNEIVAMSCKTKDEVVDAYKKLYNVTAGALQRSIDSGDFISYDILKVDAITCANKLRDNAISVLSKLEDKTESIYNMIVKWFLLKKVLYVQYMINKDILKNTFAGNVRKQRNQAKLNSEEIKFISFSELWRTSGSK
ncbi:MAG: hypothetical protein MR601_02845 [Erysipelotrichaceae bacterium]|nr:hypothetical protein [Erysipelotrichaceae bacterium]